MSRTEEGTGGQVEQWRRLASQFPEGITTENLGELAAELEQKIRALGD